MNFTTLIVFDKKMWTALQQRTQSQNSRTQSHAMIIMQMLLRKKRQKNTLEVWTIQIKDTLLSQLKRWSAESFASN